MPWAWSFARTLVHEDAAMGFHLILNCVRGALRYESEPGLTAREDNVAQLHGGD